MPLICTGCVSSFCTLRSQFKTAAISWPFWKVFLQFCLLTGFWKTKIYVNVVNSAQSHSCLSQICTGMSVSLWFPCYFMITSFDWRPEQSFLMCFLLLKFIWFIYGPGSCSLWYRLIKLAHFEIVAKDIICICNEMGCKHTQVQISSSLC